MTLYFLDSSALVKRYVRETGSEWIHTQCAPDSGNIIVVAQIAAVEIVSSVMRRKRDGLLDEFAAQRARLVIDLDMASEFRVIGLTNDVVKRAEDLLERQALRASDAIQLASALEASGRLLAGALVFVCADARLIAAAATEGLATYDPNDHS